MKASASIELIWQLAGQEAIAAEFREIEPEHFLMALLKLAETSVAEIERLETGPETMRALMADIIALRRELGARQMDAGAVRRELRKTLGPGGCPYEGGQIHRTPAARECFDRALQAAAGAGSDTLTGLHLLRAMFDGPTPAVAQVLAAIGGAAPGQPPPPLVQLYEHGKDLNRLAAESEMPGAEERIPEAKAVLRVFGQERRNSVFLAADDSAVINLVVRAAARLMAKNDVPTNLKGKRMIDLSEPATQVGASATPADILEELLMGAGRVRGVILCLPAVWSRTRQPQPWAGTLQKLASAGKVQFVAHLPREACDRAEREPDWKKIVQVIYITNDPVRDIPREL
jgi:ATP-dependent Clp protease ATP-binding subunit ClpA